MTELLRALVMATWAAIHPGPLPPDAEPIADALVQAVMADAEHSPALGSHAEDLVAMAVWAEHESRLRIEPRPESHDAVDGTSCSFLQIPCRLARRYTLAGQAKYWLWLAHYSARECPASPLAPLSSGSCARGRRLADYRTGLARATLMALLRAADSEE